MSVIVHNVLCCPQVDISICTDIQEDRYLTDVVHPGPVWSTCFLFLETWEFTPSVCYPLLFRVNLLKITYTYFDKIILDQ